ncbi:LacI family DNA-binding transcriptional regulator [Parasphaerochaeta coccoides]|uniref:Transcriptional regulator, LacI family n=1 Tax=Parasphaerochaeta coccoides (strain ATCC BAA-1237 / DSM 17374 / SPN1) TaxID=760011 RepID=F4GHN3_PARC1|nr:LacI family DNA-binding transcriptional regulator [Parasphaerochaeta coccoides]AEC01571.1 transcriptional regulator, LacI family [Parasphaerochaeta coccoides DSM 17374]
MTITEIAKIAKVSIGTVDRVLHDRGRVSPETKDKILEIIKAHDYKPNAFARNLKLNKAFRIGVLLPLLHSEYGYWSLIYQGIVKAAKELSDLTVTIDVYEFDRMQEGSCFERGKKMLARHADAVVLAPVNPMEARQVLALQKNLNYTFIDSALPDTNPVATVAQDPYKAGYLAGRMMQLLSPHAGLYVAIQTHKKAFNSVERVRGFTEYCAMHGDMDTHELELDFTEKWESQLEALYDAGKTIAGIFVVNDSVHRIAQHVSLIGRRPQTTIIGFDLIAQNRQAITDGKVDCLISQRPEFQGHTAVYQLYRKGVLNQTPDVSTEIPIDIILPENLPVSSSPEFLSHVTRKDS